MHAVQILVFSTSDQEHAALSAMFMHVDDAVEFAKKYPRNYVKVRDCSHMSRHDFAPMMYDAAMTLDHAFQWDTLPGNAVNLEGDE